MIKEKMKQLVGKSIKAYNNEYSKPKMDELKFKEQYQGRIIDCMIGEVDDNYIETPETDNHIVKLEHSKEGIVKIPSIKGKTILVDSEGNETNTPGEGCRLVSVGEEEDNKLIFLSRNRNLFEGEVEQGFINQSTGENINWMEYWRTKDYIQCKPQTIYHSNFVYKGTTDTSCTFFYDKNKNLISMTWGNPCTTPKECCFIRLAGQGEKVTLNKIDVSELKNITLYEYNKSVTYIPPKYHKTEILLDEPLHKGNSIENNQLIKSFNKIFSDKKTWTKLNADLENTILFELYINDVKSVTSNAELSNITCNRFNTRGADGGSGTWGTDIEGISVNTKGRIHIRISKDRLTSLDKNGLMKWFIENPTEILYELAEPIIEELPNSITLQGFDDTTMYIENSITPTVSYGYNALIPYKQELLNQQEEVEVNTLDIENNIIPYLMDMEYNLMLMEDN